jgi:hypothetical protein
MSLRIALGAAIALVASAGSCLAADPRYPDWPCAQAKVPEISVAQVWAGPSLEDAASKWKDDPGISALVEKLAARKFPVDEAQKSITEFLATPGIDKASSGKLLFAGLFEKLNGERSAVMSGLERVTRKQRNAADKIRGDALALQALQDAKQPDQPKIDELGNQLVWETRIFEDRRSVIRFVCEVPTTIDQRLFALARTIQQEME